MNNINEVTVFTNGDSSKLRTWSNVPFFLTETLKSRGITVNRVDISPCHRLGNLFNRGFLRIVKMVYRDTTYNFFRSCTNFINTRYRIKKAINRYPDSDVNIFLTFSFSSTGLTKTPAIQFCDWPYDHFFRYFAERKPDCLEQQSINREKSQIEGSDMVISLFSSIAENMKEHYANGNIQYLGHVINSVHDNPGPKLISYKMQSNIILFIGRQTYIAGARSLIESFGFLKQDYPELELHIIGMSTSAFESLPEDTYCHGYLDKGDDTDREKYYRLLKQARVLVNTTPKWGAFSASIEAMHFYTPIITTPYRDFTKIFGDQLEFGYYCKSNAATQISDNLIKILNHDSYDSLCISAHRSVEDFTWDACVDKMLNAIECTINTSPGSAAGNNCGAPK